MIKEFSLADLDIGKACETPFEFEVKDETTGKGVGIFLSVIGKHAPVIEDFTTKSINERRTAEAMATKRDPRGKQVHVVPFEDDVEFSTELVALRVVGWRGIKEPWSRENATLLCTTNPEIKEQILAVSENLKNYPTRYTPASSPGSDNPPG